MKACRKAPWRMQSETARVDVARHFPLTAQGQRLNDNNVDQSKIVVLSTHHEDTRLNVLRCGEALSALLLDCTMAGMATCTLTHMTELAPSREDHPRAHRAARAAAIVGQGWRDARG